MHFARSPMFAIMFYSTELNSDALSHRVGALQISIIIITVTV